MLIDADIFYTAFTSSSSGVSVGLGVAIPFIIIFVVKLHNYANKQSINVLSGCQD